MRLSFTGSDSLDCLARSANRCSINISGSTQAGKDWLMQADFSLRGPALPTDFSPATQSPMRPNTRQAFLSICSWNVVGKMLQVLCKNKLICKQIQIKKERVALDDVTKGSLIQFPVRTHAWVVGQVPSWGHVKGNHILMLLSFSFSLPSLLSK